MPTLTDEPHDPRHAGPLASAIRVVSSLTLLSRFAGLARDLIHARLMGDSAVGSAFMAAWAIPNLFRRLFGEGALSAAFLPEYARLVKTDRDLADRFASLTLLLLVGATGGLLLLGEALMLVLLLSLGHDAERSLSLRLIMLTLPYMPLVCIAAIVGGMLQAHGRFAPAAAAPIILNACVIAAAIPYYLADQTDTTRVRGAYAIGVAAVVAGALQAAWAINAMRGRIRWRRNVAGAGTPMRTLLSRFGPVVIGMGTIQLNSFLDTLLAMWPVWFGTTIFGIAFPLDDASNGILGFTQRLYQFPLGVFGIAVATAVFPLLARHADEPVHFLATLRRGLRLSLFIALPATLGLVLVRDDLTNVVYAGGRSAFSDEGLRRSALVLLGYAPGVWAFSLNHVLTRAFYAAGDTTTPMRVSLCMVGVNLVLNWILVWPFAEAGLAWATSASAMLQTIVLALLARRLTGSPITDRATALAGARTLASTLLMSAAVAGIAALLPASTWSERLVRLLASLVTGIGAFTIAARVLGQHELRWLFARSPRGADDLLIG